MAEYEQPIGSVRGDDCGMAIDDLAESTVASDDVVLTKPRRGRKPGSKNRSSSDGDDTKPAQKSSKASAIGGIESLLYSIHVMLAAALSMPELALSQSEAQQIGKALANVQRHYDITASDKAVDWANLAIVVGSIYGPRIVTAYIRQGKGHNNGQSRPVSGLSAWPAPAA